MYAKMLLLIACATVFAVALLHMRQERLDAMHDMATLHGQMNDNRQAMWRWQSRIAEASDPPALLQAIVRAELDLEPLTTQRRGVVLARVTDD